MHIVKGEGRRTLNDGLRYGIRGVFSEICNSLMTKSLNEGVMIKPMVKLSERVHIITNYI